MTKPVHFFFTDHPDPAALKQFAGAMGMDFAVKGALMPDAHLGYSLPIGAVVATEGMILPSWVGYDIGCGICAQQVDIDSADIHNRADNIFKAIYKNIPTGYKHNQSNTEMAYAMHQWQRSPQMDTIYNLKRGARQMGTLGSGNHFIEIGVDEYDKTWIIIHSGSRGVGHSCATHYMMLASGNDKAREGHFGFCTDSPEGEDYIMDLNFCLKFALLNRIEMMNRVKHVLCTELGYDKFACSDLINSNHNHAVLKNNMWIHRKGATHAEKGMMSVIPGNMRDGSFIVKGKGNPDSLWSSSHGAGRIMGRKVAQHTLSMDTFTKTMSGIKAKVEEATLDEAPGAYKDIFAVMHLQKDLVDIQCHVRPIINIKA